MRQSKKQTPPPGTQVLYADPQPIGETFAAHHIQAYCRSCGHNSQLESELLLRHFGPEYPLCRVLNALRCSRCGTRAYEVRVIWRGWTEFSYGDHDAVRNLGADA